MPPPAYSKVFSDCFDYFRDEEIIADTGCEKEVLWSIWDKYGRHRNANSPISKPCVSIIICKTNTDSQIYLLCSINDFSCYFNIVLLQFGDRVHLLQCSWFVKVYPLARSIWTNCPDRTDLPRDKRVAHRLLSNRVVKLVQLMNDMDSLWTRRWHPENDLNGVVDNMHRFMVDTYPVRVATPLSFRLSQKLWNTKYGGSVVKVLPQN
jgi:hypothetical protein